MTVPNVNTEQGRQSFLQDFFSQSGIEAYAEVWHDEFIRNGFPLILPYRLRGESTGKLAFVATDGSQFRSLQDECRAFLGRAYIAAPLERNPKVPKFLRETGLENLQCGTVSMRIDADEKSYVRTLIRWHAVWQDRWKDYKPTEDKGETATQLRDLRRKFEQSLTARNRSRAQAVIRTLDEGALLDRTNLLFLQIRLYAFFEDWWAIAENENFSDLMHVRRTDPVTEALLQSVYHTRLAEAAEKLPDMFALFPAVYNDYQPLFRVRGDLRSPEVLRLFMLRNVALPDGDGGIVADIIALPGLPDEEKQNLQSFLTYAQSIASGTANEVSGSASVPSAVPKQIRVQKESLSAARDAFQNGADDKALALIRMAPVGPDTVSTLLEFTRSTGSLAAQRITLQAMDQLPRVERSRLLSMPSVRGEISRLVDGIKPARSTDARKPVHRFPSSHSRLTEPAIRTGSAVSAKTTTPVPAEEPTQGPVAASVVDVDAAKFQTLETTRASAKIEPGYNPPPSLPANWTQWFEALNILDFEETTLGELALAGETQWSISDITTVPAKARQFAQMMDAVRDSGTLREQELFLDSLPCLIRSVANDTGFPRGEAASIYQSLRQSISYNLKDVRLDQEVLTLFYDMVLASLATGGADDYGYILEEIKDFWNKDAPSYARPLLDTLDALQDFPAHNKEARRTVATKAFALLAEWKQRGRLEPVVELYARRLAGEYGLEEMISVSLETADTSGVTGIDSDQKPEWQQLRHKKVGIYTLMESAGNRLKQLITQKCDRCDVEINAEKDGSERMRNFAQTSDIVVMVTGCAKHAATEFIERHSAKDGVILRPEGRGSSSVLVAIEKYLMSLH